MIPHPNFDLIWIEFIHVKISLKVTVIRWLNMVYVWKLEAGAEGFMSRHSTKALSKQTGCYFSNDK